MIRSAVLVALLVAAPAAAQTTAMAELAAAQRRFAEGDYQGCLTITSPLVGDPRLPKAELAESMRLHGLSLFLLGRQGDAEIFLHQFLRLEPEAHLDPALVPPEAVAFLESIRSRYEGELRRLKPRPRKKRYEILNWIPYAGQFQNEQDLKGWFLGSATVVIGLTSIAAGVTLRVKCEQDLTCSIDKSMAENLKLVANYGAAVAAATYIVGVVDAYYFGRCLEARERVALVPTEGGASLVMTFGF